MKNIKQTATETVATGKTIFNNAEQFVQAAAMLATSGFSYWALTQINVQWVLKDLVLAALIIQGLRGFYELGRFLNKKG